MAMAGATGPAFRPKPGALGPHRRPKPPASAGACHAMHAVPGRVGARVPASQGAKDFQKGKEKK